MPVKRLLDDLPSARHFEKREQVGHANIRARQVAGPASDLETNHRDRLEDVDTHHTRLNLRSGAILVDPVKEELGSDGKLFSGVAEERGIRVKGRAHQFALALFASVDVQLHGLDDSVVVGEVFSLSHAETV